MRLDGIYTGPDVNVPDGIRATGTSDEFRKAGPLRPLTGTQPIPVRDESEPYSVEVYPTKAVVEQISRKVEVQCDDQRLIDWMRTPDA